MGNNNSSISSTSNEDRDSNYTNNNNNNTNDHHDEWASQSPDQSGGINSSASTKRDAIWIDTPALRRYNNEQHAATLASVLTTKFTDEQAEISRVKKLFLEGSVPIGRAYMSCFVYGRNNSKLCVFGGTYRRGDTKNTSSFMFFNDMWSLDLNTMKWSRIEQKGAIPQYRFGASMVKLGKKVYMFGGFKFSYGFHSDIEHDGPEIPDGYGLWTDGLFILDTDTMTWNVQRTEIVTERSGHACCLVGNKMYIHGGQRAGRRVFLDDMVVYDIGTRTWSKCETRGEKPIRRAFHSMHYVNNKIYLFGGWKETPDPFSYDCEVLGDLYCLDLATMVWKKCPLIGAAPVAVAGHASFVTENRYMWVFGGREEKERRNSNIHVLDTETMKWTRLLPFGDGPAPRSGHTCCIISNGSSVQNEDFNNSNSNSNNSPKSMSTDDDDEEGNDDISGHIGEAVTRIVLFGGMDEIDLGIPKLQPSPSLLSSAERNRAEGKKGDARLVYFNDVFLLQLGHYKRDIARMFDPI